MGSQQPFSYISFDHMTRDRNKATCTTCLKADEAEQRKEDAA
jgi:hypothetical protein